MITTPRFLLFIAYLLSLSVTGTLRAQPDDYEFIDKTYLDNVATVRFHVAGFLHSYPIIGLNSRTQLRLSFDDMNDEVRRYTYRIIHCDKDWTPSNLSPLEYSTGFSEAGLQDYNFSFRTLSEYIHYDLFFPNEDINITKSGNYLLVVTDDEDDEVTAITRRFMVVDDISSVSGQVNQATNIDKIHTHQEVDFSANTKRLKLSNPLREISATVVQNGRWDNAVYNIAPNFIRRESVVFNYQGKVVFGGGNEFRNLDIRSVAAPRAEVLEITNEGDRYAMVLRPDIPRDQEIFLNYFDANGDFINFRDDRPIINIADPVVQETFARLNIDYTGDYVDMTFILRTGTEFEGDKVYLFGAFSEFQKKKKYRMTWNPAINSYVAKVLLKQGFYNYWYVTDYDEFGEKPKDLPFSLGRTEGNFDEAENDYTILIYYRPIGGRYDQLIGFKTINSTFD